MLCLSSRCVRPPCPNVWLLLVRTQEEGTIFVDSIWLGKPWKVYILMKFLINLETIPWSSSQLERIAWFGNIPSISRVPWRLPGWSRWSKCLSMVMRINSGTPLNNANVSGKTGWPGCVCTSHLGRTTRTKKEELEDTSLKGWNQDHYPGKLVWHSGILRLIEHWQYSANL